LLKKNFLLHNKNSELIDIRSFYITPVSHFIKAEPLDKIFLFFFKKSFSILKCISPKNKKKKKKFKHDDQKGFNKFFELKNGTI